MKIKTPVTYDYEDWQAFDAEGKWLASFDIGHAGPEVVQVLNAHDALVKAARTQCDILASIILEYGDDFRPGLLESAHDARNKAAVALALIEEA